MKEISVSEAFESNSKVHEKLIALVDGLTADQAAMRDVSQDKWSIAEVVEHIAIVESGIAELCRRLLERAKEAGAASDGKIRLSEHFLTQGDRSMSEKWQAPDRVRPTGNKTIEESFAQMTETRVKLDSLRPLFEEFNSSESKFPHPFLGELTAAEWLCLIGGHEVRHMRQIKRILENHPE